jgi:hypothetical protein
MGPVYDALTGGVQELKGRHDSARWLMFYLQPAVRYLIHSLAKILEIVIKGQPRWPGGLECQPELVLSQGSLRLESQKEPQHQDCTADQYTNRNFDLHLYTSL